MHGTTDAKGRERERDDSVMFSLKSVRTRRYMGEIEDKTLQ